MGHSLRCSQCWVPTGEGYPVTRRCLQWAPRGSSPAAWTGSQQCWAWDPSLSCTNGVGSSRKWDLGCCHSFSFEHLRAPSHDLSSGCSVKRAKMCWKQRAAFGGWFCCVVQCKSSDHRCRVMTVKLERILMQHICCRETLVYREQSYRVANASVCLLVLKGSSYLKWWVLLGKKK